MTYEESKQAKRDAEQRRRNVRDYWNGLVERVRLGDEAAAAAVNAMLTQRHGKRVTVAGTEYDVDEKGTFRKVKS